MLASSSVAGALFTMPSVLHPKRNAMLKDRGCLDHVFSYSQEEMGKNTGAGAAWVQIQGCVALSKMNSVLSLLPLIFSTGKVHRVS